MSSFLKNIFVDSTLSPRIEQKKFKISADKQADCKSNRLQLTERPPDKSKACQADLPVQHRSPVYSIDSNLNFTTGVEAETQIYPGDLPDIDDELPSVISSIVNKILQEAILEIHDEIEVIRLRSLASEQKRAAANSLSGDENGVITKAQLHMLIQQAIDELKQSGQSESNDENYDDIINNQFLEKIFDQIKNMVTDVTFLTGIIKNQLENWTKDSIQNNQNEFEPAENGQSGEENKSDNESIRSRRESLSTANELQNQPTDDSLEQMDTEINDYKTDDFEEEIKDLIDTSDGENEVVDRQNDLNTDPITHNSNDNVGDSDTVEINEESPEKRGLVTEEATSTQKPDDDDSGKLTDTANETKKGQSEEDAGKITALTQNTSLEINEFSQNIDNENDSQIRVNDAQSDTAQDQSSLIISKPNEEALNSANNGNNQTNNPSNAENENEEFAESINTNDTPTNGAASNDDETRRDAAVSIQRASTNDATSRPIVLNPLVNDFILEHGPVVTQIRDEAEESNQTALTIPATLHASVLGTPINELNFENDIVITEATNNDAEQPKNSNAKPSTNQQAITIPTLNAFVLDPPEDDLVVPEEMSKDARQPSKNNSSTSSANDHTLTIPAMNMTLLDPPIHDLESQDTDIEENRDQSSVQEQRLENPSSDESKLENENEKISFIKNSVPEKSTNSTDDTQSTKNNIEHDNPNDNASPPAENFSSLSRNDQNIVDTAESNNSDDNTVSSGRFEKQNPSDDQNNFSNQTSDSNKESLFQTNQSTESQSTAPTIKRDSISTNEDDIDVVVIQPSSAEPSKDNRGNLSQNPDPASDELKTSLDDDKPQEIYTNDNNDPNSTKNVSAKSSSATNESGSPQTRSPDTESVENHEIQSNTTPEDSSNLKGNSSDDGSSQKFVEPSNTENANTVPNHQSEESSELVAAQSNQSGPTSRQNLDNVSDDAETETVYVSESKPTLQDGLVADAATFTSQEATGSLMNGPTRRDNTFSNQSDIDARNNNEFESNADDKSMETNNNDSATQSKNSTTIVQNGNLIANR